MTMLEVVDVPSVVRASGRTKETNPFIDGEYGDVIKALPIITDESTDEARKGAARAFFVPGIKDTKQNKEFAKVTLQLRAAGLARDVTIRQTYGHHRVGTVDGVLITFWAIPKIVRRTKEEIAAEKLRAEVDAIELAASENNVAVPNDDDDTEAPVEAPAPIVKATRGTTRKVK